VESRIPRPVKNQIMTGASDLRRQSKAEIRGSAPAGGLSSLSPSCPDLAFGASGETSPERPGPFGCQGTSEKRIIYHPFPGDLLTGPDDLPVLVAEARELLRSLQPQQLSCRVNPI